MTKQNLLAALSVFNFTSVRYGRFFYVWLLVLHCQSRLRRSGNNWAALGRSGAVLVVITSHLSTIRYFSCFAHGTKSVDTHCISLSHSGRAKVLDHPDTNCLGIKCSCEDTGTAGSIFTHDGINIYEEQTWRSPGSSPSRTALVKVQPSVASRHHTTCTGVVGKCSCDDFMDGLTRATTRATTREHK